MRKFIELINTDNNKLLRNVGSFVYQAFKIRSEMLYERNDLI